MRRPFLFTPEQLAKLAKLYPDEPKPEDRELLVDAWVLLKACADGGPLDRKVYRRLVEKIGKRLYPAAP